MGSQPPTQPPREPSDPHGGAGGRRREPVSQRTATAAWTHLRALPHWVQFLLWLLAWPALTACFVARNRRLGLLTVPITAVVVLLGGSLWWPLLVDGTVARVRDAGDHPQPWDQVTGPGPGASAIAVDYPDPRDLPEFDPETLDVEIIGCVQTRSVSTVREGTIRQPRIAVRLTNRGPDRIVTLRGAALLADYEWNGGWKPTAPVSDEMAHGERVEITLLTDYRHQSNYTPDGLHACRVIEVEFIAPQVWPDHPARQVLPLDVVSGAAAERDFDPRLDLLRSDAR